jgi:hypothetical protein
MNHEGNVMLRVGWRRWVRSRTQIRGQAGPWERGVVKHGSNPILDAFVVGRFGQRTRDGFTSFPILSSAFGPA